MAAYTGIQGQNILIVSSDPSNPTEGQIWYNSTTNLLKGYANVVLNSWASGGNLNTASSGASVGPVGTQNASMMAGGTPGFGTNNELYNGTSWTASTALPAGRNQGASFGSQTAAVLAGGNPGSGLYTNTCIIWNGSSWSPTGNLNTSRGNAVVGYGTQTAGLGAGGYNASPSGNSVATESFNGTSWTTVNSLNTARRGAAGAGVQTAAIYFGGGEPAASDKTESWNGTSWTSAANLPSAIGGGMGGMGVQTAAVGFGGGAYLTQTLLYNGTSWSINPNSMATARINHSSGGTQTAGLAIGGRGTSPAPGTPTAATEEWTGQAVQVRTITTS